MNHHKPFGLGLKDFHEAVGIKHNKQSSVYSVFILQGPAQHVYLFYVRYQLSESKTCKSIISTKLDSISTLKQPMTQFGP